MIDKSKELKSYIRLVNDKLNFVGIIGENEPVSIDYISPLGDDSGYTSLELLLLSLTSCIGSALLTFLRKMKKTISACEIHATGIRKQEHPTGFKQILVEINLKSPEVSEEDMVKVLKLAEDSYCPVWSMLKGNVEVEVTFEVERN